MKGCLIINSFLNSKKFDEIYELFKMSFAKHNVNLDILTNVEAIKLLHKSEKTYNFIIFWDKDISLAQSLENKGYKVYNSSKVIAICDDKGLTYNSLINKKINMPKTISAPKTFDDVGYSSYDFIDIVSHELNYPMIIKESFGSFGKQVYLVHNKEEAVNVVKKIGSRPFIFQEFIKESFGKDIRVQVVGNKIIASVLRVAKGNEFRANVSNGGTMQETTLTNDQKKLALKVCKLLKIDFAGIDILFGKNGQPVLCEINSNAHFKNLLDTTGKNTADAIAKYILSKQ